MALINSPPETAISALDQRGQLMPPSGGWRNFFVAVFNICNALTLSGTTAQRPTGFLFVGRTFFDTTLGIPIWVLTPTAGAVVWINAAGAVV